jgi:putative ABC transport system permease protein
MASVYGRIAPGRGIEAVSAEVRSVAQRLDRTLSTSGRSTPARPRLWSAVTAADNAAQRRAASNIGELVAVVFVGLILAVASTNLANLFLARGADREAERAIRVALGASRSRILAESLAETGLLAALGGLGATLVTQVTMVACTRYVVYGLRSFYFAPHWDRSTWTLEILLLTLSFACFGVLPAWRMSRLSGSPSTKRPPVRLRRFWIVGQVATVSALLMVSMMCLNELERAWHRDAGVDYTRVDVALLSFVTTGRDQSRIVASERTIMDAVARHPEFDSVSVSSTLPFGDWAPPSIYITPAEHPFQGDVPSVSDEEDTVIDASPSLFRTLDIAIVRGRPLDSRDVPDARPNIVIGQRVAQHLFGTSDPLNRTVLLRGGREIADRITVTPATIVGVAEATDTRSLYDRAGDAIYVPLGQYQGVSATIAARTANPEKAAGTFEHAVRAADPDAIVTGSGPGAETLSGDYVALKPIAEITSGLGIAALALAMCGLYGVLLDVVTHRFSEMGIRLALGADPQRLVRMVIGQGLRPVLWGLPVGMCVAVLGRKLIQHDRAFTADLFDPLTVLYAALPLILTALWACYWPARRASRVDPTIVLRAE